MIRALAIDDEPLALQLIEGYIKKTPFLEFVAACQNPKKAIPYLERKEVDLIFLDIQMPFLTGTEFARIIDKNVKIVFSTAFEKYAIEGFKLEAIDYLLKPYGYEDFLTSALKAKKQIELESRPEVKDSDSIETHNDFLFLRADYKIRRITYDQILYIEGLKDYIKIFIKEEPKPIITHCSLKILEDKLPESIFMRIHRSIIVNLKNISVIDRNRVVFGKEYLPVSDQYKDKFQKYLDDNFL